MIKVSIFTHKLNMTSEISKSYKVEYLCTINSDGDFCTTISSFSSLLESYEKLKIDGKKLFWGEKEFLLEISDGTVLNSEHKFFHIKLTNNNDENKKEFLSALRVIRTILSKVNNGQPPEILWDDISSEYAVQSYPVIHQLENLMRKLITKFMITKVGLSWTKDNIPKEVSESIKKSNAAKKQNYIYDTDFIQLSNFLFKEYTTANVDEFVEKIKKANDVSDLNLEELKKIVPLSNWTRYFNPIVECTSDELASKWSKLYELRCKVAHNNFMDEEDFNNLITNSKAVQLIIQDAIDNLDKVNIKEEEKEELAENAAINLNKIYGEYVSKWKQIVKILQNISFTLTNTKRPFVTFDGIRHLYKNGYISETEFKKFDELRNLRNLIVHESNFVQDEMVLNSALKELVLWENKLSNIAALIEHNMGMYEISKSNNGQFRVALRSFNGELLLISENFKSKASAVNLVDSIAKNAINYDNFDIKETSNGKYYFDLKASNHQILATSKFYEDMASLTIGLELVKRNSLSNKIIDLTEVKDNLKGKEQ